MAEGRDFSHEAYQAPFTEKYGAYIGALTLLLIGAGWLLSAKPWEFQRAATALAPDAPQRLSTADDVSPLFTRQTHRVAIHGSAVYVTWVDDRTEPPALLIATSTDSGKSFTERVAVEPELGQRFADPAVLTDSSGSLYLLYTFNVGEKKVTSKTFIEGKQNAARDPMHGGATITSRLGRSDDGGATWKLVRQVQSVYAPNLYTPVMDIDGSDTLHLAALAIVGGQEQVVVTHSKNSGDTFEADIQVSTATKGRRRDLAIAASESGRVAVLWSDLRNAPDMPENGEIYGALAQVGKEFSPEIALIKPALKPGRQRHPSVTLTDSGELNVIFQEGIEKERRDRSVLRYAHSTTFGKEFAASQTLFEKQLFNPTAVQMVTGRDGFAYLTCIGTLTDRDQPTILIAQSKTGGRTFSALTPVVDRFTDAVESPSLEVQGNTIMLSYFDYFDPEGAPGSKEVYAVRIVDNDVKG